MYDAQAFQTTWLRPEMQTTEQRQKYDKKISNDWRIPSIPQSYKRKSSSSGRATDEECHVDEKIASFCTLIQVWNASTKEPQPRLLRSVVEQWNRASGQFKSWANYSDTITPRLHLHCIARLHIVRCWCGCMFGSVPGQWPLCESLCVICWTLSRLEKKEVNGCTWTRTEQEQEPRSTPRWRLAGGTDDRKCIDTLGFLLQAPPIEMTLEQRETARRRRCRRIYPLSSSG